MEMCVREREREREREILDDIQNLKIKQRLIGSTKCFSQSNIVLLFESVIRQRLFLSMFCEYPICCTDFFVSLHRYNSPAHQNRLAEVERAIESRGTYDLTTAELTYGAKTAWRNAPRCIGRIQWSKLQVILLLLLLLLITIIISRH